MKKLFFIIYAIVFLIFVSGNIVFAEDQADTFRAAVKDIFTTYSSATVKGDVDAWLALWDEMGVKMVPNQPSINGTKAIGELKRKVAEKREYLTMDITIEDAQGAGDFGFAHGTYAASFKPKDGGATGSGGGKFLTIFKKQANGSWKIYRDSVSPNSPPQ